jgi:hypothetical protein
VAEGLFMDVRRFASPPGRPRGAERFEPRPSRRVVRRAVSRWLERWRGTDGDPFAIPSYLPSDWH